MIYIQKNIFFHISLIFLLFFLTPSFSYASSLFFETTEPLYSINTSGNIEVYLDTNGQIVNTVSGSVSFESYNSSTVDIVDGNSSLLFWIDRPRWDEESQSISFSGITPGGFSGDRIFLFSFNIYPENLDPIELSFENSSVLLHDGEGTLIETESLSKTIFVSTNSRNPLRSIPEDRESPEDFTPIITKDEHLYNGQYVIVFATQDKGSGIALYQIREGLLGRFKEVESPYILRNQNRMNMITIRAIDRSGNVRSVVIHPQEDMIIRYGIFVIVAILLVLVVFYIRKKK